MSVEIRDGWISGTLPGPGGKEIWVRQFRQGPFEGLAQVVPNLTLHTTETDGYVEELEFPSQFQVGEGFIGQHKPLWAKGEALRGDSTNDPFSMGIEIVGHSKLDVWLPQRSSLDPLVALCAWLHSKRFIRTALERPVNFDTWPVRLDRGPQAVESYYRRRANVWPSVAGVYGHVEIPGNTHWDPGSFDYPAFWKLVRDVLEEPMTPEEKQAFAELKERVLELERVDEGETRRLKSEPEPANEGPIRRGWRRADRFLREPS